jgi:hypothetical protein
MFHEFPIKFFGGCTQFFFVVLQITTLISCFYLETLGTLENKGGYVFIGYICKFNFEQNISLDKM